MQTLTTLLKSHRVFKVYRRSVRTGDGSKNLYYIPRNNGDKPATTPAAIGKAYDAERQGSALKFTRAGRYTTNEEKGNE